MADEADGGPPPAKKKGGGLMGLLVPVLVLTLLAAGGGGLIGAQIVSSVKRSLAPPDAKPAAEHAAAEAAPAAPETALKELTPVVTNLAAPDNAAWVRLQAAIVYNKADAPQIETMSAKIGDDVLAVLRTLTLEEIQGASGLELLREDLNERAAIRSDGHIRELMIEMLVVQ